MTGNDYRERIHAELLTIMDEIVRVCDKHHIKYYMAEGTLLGAARHKGFIPWDDDMDIAMPREDFDRFIGLCDTELQAPFALSWITVHENYRHLFAKVENRNTAFFEGTRYEPDVYPGIFVDIFPLDSTDGYSRSLERRKFLVRKIAVMKGMKLHKGRLPGIKGLIVHCLSWKTLNKLGLCFMTKRALRGGSWYTNFASLYNVRKQTFQKAVYGEGVLLPFEGRMYNAPAEYLTVLHSVYGPGFMDIPPEDQRRTHYPKYVKFSDGSELEFEEPGRRVEAEL